MRAGACRRAGERRYRAPSARAGANRPSRGSGPRLNDVADFRGDRRELLLHEGARAGRLFPLGPAGEQERPQGEEDRDARGDPVISFQRRSRFPFQGGSADVPQRKSRHRRPGGTGPAPPRTRQDGRRKGPREGDPVGAREGVRQRRRRFADQEHREGCAAGPCRSLPKRAQEFLGRSGHRPGELAAPPSRRLRRPEAAGRRSTSKGRSVPRRPGGFGGEKKESDRIGDDAVHPDSRRSRNAPTRFPRTIAARRPRRRAPILPAGPAGGRTGSPRPRSAGSPRARPGGSPSPWGDRSPERHRPEERERRRQRQHRAGRGSPAAPRGGPPQGQPRPPQSRTVPRMQRTRPSRSGERESNPRARRRRSGRGRGRFRSCAWSPVRRTGTRPSGVSVPTILRVTFFAFFDSMSNSSPTRPSNGFCILK